MSGLETSNMSTVQALSVLQGRDLIVVDGANQGDPLTTIDEVELGDVYRLNSVATPVQLDLDWGAEGFRVVRAHGAADPGGPVMLESVLTFMCPDGTTADVLLLVQQDSPNAFGQSYLLPLMPVAPRTAYTLVGVDRENAATRLAEVSCMSFTQGTRITSANGAQTPVENLKVGDRVLTRDGGAQAIRWVGKRTMRAVGDFAPVLVREGALNNAHDLLVSPDHRFFVYQRADAVGAGRSEVLVKARHLVDGVSVIIRPGGFVDYYQLLFDDHQIIYAEGIAAESFLVDARTAVIVPDTLRPARHKTVVAGLDYTPARGDHGSITETLRRASLG